MPEDQVKISKQPDGDGDMTCCSDGAHYPYGTSLSFGGELLGELGIENLVVGDVVEVRGFAFVDHKSEHSTVGSSDKNLTVQLTVLELRRETGDRAEQLYGPDAQ